MKDKRLCCCFALCWRELLLWGKAGGRSLLSFSSVKAYEVQLGFLADWKQDVIDCEGEWNLADLNVCLSGYVNLDFKELFYSSKQQTDTLGKDRTELLLRYLINAEHFFGKKVHALKNVKEIWIINGKGTRTGRKLIFCYNMPFCKIEFFDHVVELLNKKVHSHQISCSPRIRSYIPNP